MRFENTTVLGSKFLTSCILTISILTGCETSNNTSASREQVPSQTYSTNSNVIMSNASMTLNNTSGRAELRNIVGSDVETQDERYAKIEENPFLETSRAPLSTFSIDVDTASYANVRRYLNKGQLPPKDAVRIEELINYFDYDYPQPIGDIPFSVITEIATCAWNPNNKIVSIGLQGKKVLLEDAPPSNLVFLLDVSGSMNSHDRLPLVKQGLKTLARQISAKDKVAIVVYAGASGLVLSSTNNRDEILGAIDNLEAGGSTNGGQGN
jgi:Ca-activated chloride channel family protein